VCVCVCVDIDIDIPQPTPLSQRFSLLGECTQSAPRGHSHLFVPHQSGTLRFVNLRRAAPRIESFDSMYRMYSV